MSLLEVDSIDTYYGQSQALADVSLRVERGEVVALLGRNGAGKTTTIRSILGINPPRKGTVRYDEEDITGMEPYEIAQRGLGYIPEHREVWGDLTVEENLRVPAGKGGDRTIQDVYNIFPTLAELSASDARNLSGGEKQMLAIGRGILGGTELLLMDEASEGLAPSIVRDVRDAIHELKSDMTILMIEQNTEMALQAADRVYILENGSIGYEGDVTEVRDNEEILREKISVN